MYILWFAALGNGRIRRCALIDLARVVTVGKGRVHPMIHTGLVSRCTLPLHLGNVTIACVVE